MIILMIILKFPLIHDHAQWKRKWKEVLFNLYGRKVESCNELEETDINDMLYC